MYKGMAVFTIHDAKIMLINSSFLSNAFKYNLKAVAFDELHFSDRTTLQNLKQTLKQTLKETLKQGLKETLKQGLKIQNHRIIHQLRTADSFHRVEYKYARTMIITSYVLHMCTYGYGF